MFPYHSSLPSRRLEATAWQQPPGTQGAIICQAVVGGWEGAAVVPIFLKCKGKRDS